MWRSRVAISIIAAVACGAPPRLNAQTVEIEADTTTADSVVHAGFRVEIDSVTVVQPLGDTITYEAYTIAQCAQAIARVAAAAHRTGPDTARYTAAYDTLPTAAVTAARRCAARFTVDNVGPRDLLWLARVDLAAGDTTNATAAINRRLVADSAAGPGALARTLGDVISTYIDAQPHRADLARPYITQLDSLPIDEAVDVVRVGTNTILAGYFFNTANNDTASGAAAQAAIAAGQRLNPHDRQEFVAAITSAYNILARLALDAGGLSVARQVLAQGRADIAPIVADGVPENVTRFDPVDTVYALYGTPAEPLRGGRWLGSPGPTTRPTKGRLALIVLSPERYTMPMFRRIAHEFGDRLEMSFVTQTVGYFDGQGPVTTEKEIGYLDRYLRKELAAPAPIIVYETTFHELPDDRRESVPLIPQRAYKAHYGVTAVLVDRTGIIRRVYTTLNETRLEDQIRALL